MATTVPVPLTTLTVGTHDVGPASLGTTESSAVVTIDRTVPGGLNSLTASTIFTLEIWVSLDGGTTWIEVGRGKTLGGLYLINVMNPGLGNQTSSWIHYQLPYVGQARQVKAEIVVAGPSSVAVSGSLALS